MTVTQANNCWEFTSYNSEPFYGLGTKAQALTYLTILNRAKTINFVEVEPAYKDASFLEAVAIDLLSEIRDQGDKEEDLESLQGIRVEMSNFTQALDDIITELAGPDASWDKRNDRGDAGISRCATYSLRGLALIELSKMRNQLNDIIQAMDERGVDNDL